jgi:hypothetical protein
MRLSSHPALPLRSIGSEKLVGKKPNKFFDFFHSLSAQQQNLLLGVFGKKRENKKNKSDFVCVLIKIGYNEG